MPRPNRTTLLRLALRRAAATLLMLAALGLAACSGGGGGGGTTPGDVGDATADATGDADAAGRCGDGVIDESVGEECEPDLALAATCEGLGFDEGTLTCGADCRLDTTGCADIDAVCGDGIVEGDEECDGDNLDGQDCSTFLFRHGVLRCTDRCRVSTLQCNNIPVCGDNIVEDPEECDDGNTEDGDGCAADCKQERCGDGIVQASLGEECDGDTLTGPCESDPSFLGIQTCEADCTLGPVLCPDADRCGDGVVDIGEDCDDGNNDDDDGCSSICEAEAICGDGVRAPEERCDGDDFGGLDCGELGFEAGALTCDDCSIDASECRPIICGDGFVDEGEECDDGNAESNDGCSRRCLDEFCGDGRWQSALAEQCDGDDIHGARCVDFGYLRGPLSCTPRCVFSFDECVPFPTCGDGVVEEGEECDDGNTRSGDGCSAACREERCGDDILQESRGEECEPGLTLGATCADLDFFDGVLTCTDGCTFDTSGCREEPDPICGNGVLEDGEACDGDDLGGRTCEDLGLPFGALRCDDDCSADASACSAVPVCGDGSVDGREQCDDGNVVSGDGCSAECREEGCGDRILQPALGEECEVGGVEVVVCDEVEGDPPGIRRCSDECRFLPPACDESAECGNGVVELGEACDDGNLLPDDGCSPSCESETCGDGIRQSSEACDGDDLGELTCESFEVGVGPLGCTDTCRFSFDACRSPRCGDGEVDPDADEECDDGNNEDGDGCTADCRVESCGDGILQPELGEACDDEDVPGDGCFDLGFGGGVVSCTEECALDPATCEPPASCGDGMVDVEAGEECDDGNTTSGDGCSGACRSERCGDRVVQSGIGEECEPALRVPTDCLALGFDEGIVRCTTACELDTSECVRSSCGDGTLDAGEGEECDDGNRVSGDGCSAECVVEFCGDGVVQPALDEACDDGEGNSDTEPGACRTDCTEPTCGDDVVDPDEGCDDGADNSDTEPGACRTSCVPAGCGDGVVDPDETCDAGLDNSDTEPDACRTSCVPAFCGDTVVDTDEACDDGEGNSDTEPGACRTDCTEPFCGDGVTDLDEGCDDGDANSDTEPGACRTSCVPAFCGDGILDPTESCDDGEENSDTAPDACRTTCEPAFCGDGVVDADEACDEGEDNSDTEPGACRTDCSEPMCGDGVTDPDEGCDDGEANSDTEPGACRIGCVPAFCGDGIVDPAESCDDGAENSDTAPDACRTSCVPAFCGDGVLDSGEACDEGEENSDTASGACRTTCELPRCGDGVVDPDELCDDGNNVRGDGCSAECVREAPPVGRIEVTSPASGNAPLEVTFDATGSVDADGTIVSYAWDFGDGATATGPVVTHTYGAGRFVATLTVTDDLGAVGTAASPEIVSNGTPEPAFTATPLGGPPPLAVTFDAGDTTDIIGTIASYEWSFGDGGTATGEVVEHTYEEIGRYTVTLTVTDDLGASASTSDVVIATAFPTPIIDLSPTAGFAPLVVTADASGSTDDDGTIVSYSWDFGDGTGAQGATVGHTFSQGGDYIVELTVVDDLGASASTTTTLSVLERPFAAFEATPTIGPAPLDVSLDGSASVDDSEVVSWSWDFGDGTTGEGETTVHRFEAAGIYLVSLTVQDDNGLSSDPSQRWIRVTEPDVDATWIGGDSAAPTDWSNGANWSGGVVPGASATALVPADATTFPALTAAASIGTLRVESGATVDTTTFDLTVTDELDGDIVGDGRVIVAGTNVALRGAVPTLDVQGSAVLAGDLDVGCDLFVRGEARFDVNGGVLEVGCDLDVTITNTANDGFRMLQVEDHVTVLGDAIFHTAVANSSATSFGNFTAGELHLHGGLTQRGDSSTSSPFAFVSTGTTVVFDGGGASAVVFEDGAAAQSRFNNVVVANGSSVEFATHVAVTGQLTMMDAESTLSQTASVATRYTSALPQTDVGYEVMNNVALGTVAMREDAVLPNGASLTVDRGSVLRPQGHRLDVTGDLTVRLTNAARDGLQLTDPGDIVTVDGRATWLAETAQSSATSEGTLTAGQLVLRGGFQQQRGSSTSSHAAFVSTGTTVVFDGASAQSVSFNTPGRNSSRFDDVELNASATVALDTTVVVMGQLTMHEGAGSLTQSSGETVYYTALPATTETYAIPTSVADGDIAMSESRTLPGSSSLRVDDGGSLRVGPHTLSVGGDLVVQLSNRAADGLWLVDASGLVEVGGDTRFSSIVAASEASSAGKLTAGTLRLHGGLAQDKGSSTASTSALISTGTLVEFSGSGETQAVSLTGTSTTASRLHDVTVREGANVSYDTDVTITGALVIEEGGGLEQSAGLKTLFTTALPSTSSGYFVAESWVIDDIVVSEDRAIPNGGNLQIEPGGSLRVGAHSVTIDGALTARLSNRFGDGVHLTDPAGVLTVMGLARFASASTQSDATSEGLLTAGTLRLGGGFVQTRESSTASVLAFVSTGTAVELIGTDAQNISFFLANETTSRFHDLVVRAGASANLSTSLGVTGQLTVEEGGTLTQSGGQLRLTSALPVTSSLYQVTDHVVRGAIDVSTDRTLPNGGSLSISPGASVNVGPHTLAITGGLTVEVSNETGDGLRMNDEAGVVDVRGDALFWSGVAQSTATTAGMLTAGELRLGGDFEQTRRSSTASSDAFVNTGTAVRFDGTAPQAVSMFSPSPTGSAFHDVTIAAGAEVDFATQVVVTGQLVTEEDATLTQSVGETHFSSALPITTSGYAIATSVTAGDVVLDGDRTLPAGSSLRIDPGTSVDIGAFALVIGGDLFVSVSNDAGDGLVMDDADGVVDVLGEITFETASAASSATSEGLLTAGRIIARSDFNQTRGSSTSSNTTFVSTGTTVEFAGTALQTVRFSNPGRNASRFHDAVIAAGATVDFASSQVFDGVLSVEAEGTLSQSAGQTFVRAALPVVTGEYTVPDTHVFGDVTAVDGTVLPSGRRVTIDSGGRLILGDATVELGELVVTLSNEDGDGLVMTEGGGRLIVRNDFTITVAAAQSSATARGQLTAGTIEIHGAVSSTRGSSTASTEGFVFTGTALELAGDGEQIVRLSNPGSSEISELVLNNGGTATLESDLPVLGTLRSGPAGGSLEASDRTVTIDGNVTLSGASFDGVNLRILTTDTSIDDSSFASPNLNADRITIEAPGLAEPLTWTNLSFSGEPTGGHYVVATDTTPSDGNVLTIDIVDAFALNGPAHTEVAGGAIVNWTP